MIYDIQKPTLSPEFTIADIHKICEWNYERLKDVAVTERLEEIKRQAEPDMRAIEKLKAARKIT
jgi:hypothetical protein